MKTAAPPSSSRRQVAVIGSGSCAQTSRPARLAEDVGRRLAEAGVAVICGGLGGVMEAVSRGAGRAGGTVIGIVPGTAAGEANPECTEVIASGVGAARNLAVVASGEVVIAIGGEWGTLSEIGHARSIGRVVVALHSWKLSGPDRMQGAPGLLVVESAAAAVEAAVAILAESKEGLGLTP